MSNDMTMTLIVAIVAIVGLLVTFNPSQNIGGQAAIQPGGLEGGEEESDLVITSVDLLEGYYYGSPFVHFQVGVQNIGDWTADIPQHVALVGVWECVNVDCTQKQYLGQLDGPITLFSGNSISKRFHTDLNPSITLEPGDYTLLFEVNSDGWVDESDYTNNFFMLDVEVVEFDPLFGLEGTISVSGTPAGAEVYTKVSDWGNYLYKGTTSVDAIVGTGVRGQPFHFDIYDVLIMKEGYISEVQTVGVTGGSTTTVNYNLVPVISQDNRKLD